VPRPVPSNVYSECSRFHLNRFIFGGVKAERVITVKSRPKVIQIFGGSLASSRIITEDSNKWRKYVHGVANPLIEDG